MQTNKINNSEILFIYDAKDCNPNGDPDNENKPRIDVRTQRNLVSDVRLKRYIRDYFLSVSSSGKDVFVSKVDGKTVDATGRFAYFLADKVLANQNVSEYKKCLDEALKTPGKEDKRKRWENLKTDRDKLEFYIRENTRWDLSSAENLLDAFIDIRLFGITLPIKDLKRGSSITFTGPIQFAWGYSLNKVEIMDSSSITSHLAGRTKGTDDEGSAIGKDWRLYYSFIAFYGRISANAVQSRYTNLSQDDVEELDKAAWNSIITQTNTRTKLNQTPRLYLRVEYNNNETCIGDLRRYVKLEEDNGLRDINEITLDLKELIDKFSSDKYKEKVNKILFKQHEDLKNVKIEELLIKAGFNGKIQECK